MTFSSVVPDDEPARFPDFFLKLFQVLDGLRVSRPMVPRKRLPRAQDHGLRTFGKLRHPGLGFLFREISAHPSPLGIPPCQRPFRALRDARVEDPYPFGPGELHIPALGLPEAERSERKRRRLREDIGFLLAGGLDLLPSAVFPFDSEFVHPSNLAPDNPVRR